MDLKDDLELAMTRTKLQRLEARYEAARMDTHENPRVRESTMRSLKGTINQFKEEITRYLARKPRLAETNHSKSEDEPPNAPVDRAQASSRVIKS